MPFLSYTQQFNDNLLMLLLRDHERYMPIVEFFDNVTQGLSELSWSDSELLAAEVSKANDSEFCTGIRGGMIKTLKGNPDKLSDEKFAVVLKFALKTNRNPKSIMQKDIDEVLNAGWSEQTIEDIVGLVAIQRFYNILATGLGFKQLPETVFDEIGQDTHSKGGYVASFKQYIQSSV